jgi:hypothetical protein
MRFVMATIGFCSASKEVSTSDLLPQRSLAARYEKVRRGELVVRAPVGFLKARNRYEKRTAACRRLLLVPAEPVVNWPPFRPDTRHSSEGLGISSSTCLCRTIISGLN